MFASTVSLDSIAGSAPRWQASRLPDIDKRLSQMRAAARDATQAVAPNGYAAIVQLLENSMTYICSICGHTSTSASGGSCSHSPSRSHIYIQEDRAGYICKFCGHTASSASGGSCSPSPFGAHQYIARHGGPYRCMHCGHTSTSASSGSCSKSPHKHHEYI